MVGSVRRYSGAHRLCPALLFVRNIVTVLFPRGCEILIRMEIFRRSLVLIMNMGVAWLKAGRPLAPRLDTNAWNTTVSICTRISPSGRKSNRLVACIGQTVTYRAWTGSGAGLPAAVAMP